jgi:hypothetical protein
MSTDIKRQFSSRSSASSHQCDECPPERICAWACVQGAGLEEIVVGAMLALEGRTSPALLLCEPDTQPITEAIWDSYNA